MYELSYTKRKGILMIIALVDFFIDTGMSSSNHSPSTLGDQLLVDFPTRRRRPTVRFDPQVTVHPIRSTLTMIFDKRELWYSGRDVDDMKLERNSDAIALARTLLSPSAEDLKEGGIHVSQANGLDNAVNPIEAKSKLT
jgi:hypothetical protein